MWCACCRLEMDPACDVWVPVGSGRPPDVSWPDSEVVDEKSKVAPSSLALAGLSYGAGVVPVESEMSQAVV